MRSLLQLQAVLETEESNAPVQRTRQKRQEAARQFDRHEQLSSLPEPVTGLLPRQELLDAIDERLAKAPVVVLHGLGGAGKSQLALQYARCRQRLEDPKEEDKQHEDEGVEEEEEEEEAKGERKSATAQPTMQQPRHHQREYGFARWLQADAASLELSLRALAEDLKLELKQDCGLEGVMRAVRAPAMPRLPAATSRSRTLFGGGAAAA